MKTQIIITFKFLLIMTILTGIVYPLLMTGLAQIIFPYQANGSLIKKDGKVIGSELLGQKFDSVAYFWSRPSAIDYNPVPSGASNLGPTSDKLKKLVSQRRNAWFAKDSTIDTLLIPNEMLFASASGLDPHISPRAAKLQLGRVAKARRFTEEQTQKLAQCITRWSEQPQFTLLGEARVNVLLLNLEVDKIK